MSKDKITLQWMNRLRKRLAKKEFGGNEEIKRFIRPIMRYGVKEEKYISEQFGL